MSLGSKLREARERKGLTITQVAEQTRMIHQLVEEIENDDFHRITAPLYGRGFIKLFAECVEEDPAPLMQEFTEIYSGLRRPGVRTRPVQTPVESPEVAEPKDRNAPPPRPKVRHVVVADDPEEAPAAPVETPKATEKDAPTARPSGRFMETSLPVSAPAESPKAIVAGDLPVADGEGAVATQGEGPASSGPNAPTDESTHRQTEELNDRQTDKPSDRPTVEPSNPQTNGGTGNGERGTEDDRPTVEPSNRLTDEPTNRLTDEPTNRLTDEPTNRLTDEPTNRLTEKPADDESLLGDLFDLVARKRSQRSDEPSTDKHEVKDESSVKISLPAPSWDDAPLEEDGDFWQKLSNIDKWRYWKVGAALAGLCLLAVIVFAVVAKHHSKPEEAKPPVVSQTTAVSEPQPEPQPEPAPAELSTPTPTRNSNSQPEPAPAELSTPTPTPTLNSNSQPETPSAEAATAASADGRTVYTANLIPPPDSYVE